MKFNLSIIVSTVFYLHVQYLLFGHIVSPNRVRLVHQRQVNLNRIQSKVGKINEHTRVEVVIFGLFNARLYVRVLAYAALGVRRQTARIIFGGQIDLHFAYASNWLLVVTVGAGCRFFLLLIYDALNFDDQGLIVSYLDQ